MSVRLEPPTRQISHQKLANRRLYYMTLMTEARNTKISEFLVDSIFVDGGWEGNQTEFFPWFSLCKYFGVFLLSQSYTCIVNKSQIVNKIIRHFRGFK